MLVGISFFYAIITASLAIFFANLDDELHETAMHRLGQIDNAIARSSRGVEAWVRTINGAWVPWVNKFLTLRPQSEEVTNFKTCSD